MRKKVVNYFRHKWQKTFSKAYRTELMIKEGAKLWEKLDESLLPAVGVIKDDIARLKQFKGKVENMSEKKRTALKLYLEQETNRWEGSDMLLTGREEESIDRVRQIYATHLEIVQNTFLTHLLKGEE